jgi:hypothetical protein
MIASPALAITSSIADTATAADVRRGVSRWLWRCGVAPLPEVPLGNGRRADVLGVDGKGRITIVEIKVSLGDLRGDRKWPDYLDFCDRFFWAVPSGLPRDDLDTGAFQPDRTGVLVADRFDAALLRDAALVPMNAGRRKAETLALARRASERLLALTDPDAGLLPRG